MISTVNKGSKIGSHSRYIAQVLKALAHPSRVALLELMIAEGAVSFVRMVAETGLAQANISQHLHILVNAGVVKRVPGSAVAYYLAQDDVKTILEVALTVKRSAVNVELAALK